MVRVFVTPPPKRPVSPVSFAFALQADLAAQFAADFDDEPAADEAEKPKDTFKVPDATAMDVDDVQDESSDDAGSEDDEEARLAREKALADAVKGANSVYDVTKLYNSPKLQNLLEVRSTSF